VGKVRRAVGEVVTRYLNEFITADRDPPYKLKFLSPAPIVKSNHLNRIQG
jgi:hypothetical protein